MLAAVLHGAHDLRIEQIRKPSPARNEVLVQVAYTGICGSDVPRVLQGTVKSFPLVPGHEFSGYVVEVGVDVNRDLLGRLVGGVPLIPCHACERCLKGDYALCSRYSFMGSRQQGSMAEFIAVPAINVLPLDEAVGEVRGAFLEPAAVAVHAIEMLDPIPDSYVAVVGAGTIGILLAQALSAYRTKTVVCFNRSAARLATAEASGLRNLVLTSEENWVDKAGSITDGKLFDYVFDVVGSSGTIADSLKIAAPHAQVCVVGTPKEPPQFTVQQWEQLNRKELTLKGSWMSYSAPWPGKEWKIANKLFKADALRIHSSMIDSVYPLAAVNEAFERYSNPPSVKGKLLINCNDSKDSSD
jgi:L-iditol 2-dehydrogenase